MKIMNNKQMSLAEAVSFVKSGMVLALGGMTLYRRPMAFTRELIRYHRSTGTPSNLTLLNFTAGIESDLLVGSGMIKTIRSCYFGLEIFGLAPMFTHFASLGEVEIIEETEASLALGLRAQISGIGFLPGRAWLGTDLPRLRPDVKTITDPYTGEELMAFPAIKPDVVVIHALATDEEGNAIIGQNKAVDNELVLAADFVILTTEKLVPKLDKVDLVAPLITGIVLAPGGAKPTSCHPAYDLDGSEILRYTEQVSDRISYSKYIDDWLSGS
jgi:glutaconate CoA-transferase, subunit A